jgi:hypothetical protein
MRPDATTLLFKEAFEVFPPIEGKPTNDDLLSIKEVLLPLLMIIPFDTVSGFHTLTALLTDENKYATAHAGIKIYTFNYRHQNKTYALIHVNK